VIKRSTHVYGRAVTEAVSGRGHGVRNQSWIPDPPWFQQPLNPIPEE